MPDNINTPVPDPWLRIYNTNSQFKNVGDVLATTAIGDGNTAISRVFSGVNHRGNASSVAMNKDYYGLAFFSRPDMNMTTKNLLRNRKFTPLLTSNNKSIPRAIRASLDITCDNHANLSYTCPLIDQKNIFIPILSNHLISMSGWPDMELPTYTTSSGVQGEAISFADGIVDINRTFDLTCNFRNMSGSPILELIRYWMMYISNVTQGTMQPHPVNIAQNTVDYQTRIWRLVLDNTKRFVQKIASSVACFPLNNPIGASFNFEIDTPVNRSNDQLSFNFRCHGAEYNDDILIHEFNRSVIYANADMEDGSREGSLVKLPGEYLHHFNYTGYPRINPGTFELEWWVYKIDWQAVTGSDGGAEGEYDTSYVD